MTTANDYDIPVSIDGSIVQVGENRFSRGFLAGCNADLLNAVPQMIAALKDARALIEDASAEFFTAEGLLPPTIAGIERAEWQITLARIIAAIPLD